MVQYYGPREDLGFRFVHSYVLPFPEWPALLHVSDAAFIPGHRGDEHLHHALELTYIISGSGERHVNGHVHRLVARDYHVVAAGELHMPRADHQDPFHYVTIGLKLEHVPAFSDSEVAQAFARIHPLRARVVPGGAGGDRAFRRLIAELGKAELDPRLRSLRLLMVQTLVCEIVVRFARCVLGGDRREEEPEVVRPAIQDLLAWLGTRLRQPPGTAEMAKRLGLSPGHFITTFRRELGRTPLEHMTAMRIAEAARRLASGEDTVSSIAQDLGFCSSRYFSQVFRKARGCTPREWRERNRP
jgi:AraC-like DNA-binding protein